MKTIATSIVLICVILGCASNQPRVQYSLYQPIAGEIAPGEKIQTELSGGVLTVDGQRVLDEEGDINSVYTINDKVYYFISKKTPSRKSSIMFILKTLDGHKIKEFEGQAIIVTPSSTHLPLILVKLSGSGNTYDNIYTFDGDKVSLVNKNVPVYGSSVISSNFVFTPKYRRSDNEIKFEGTGIVDLKTGKAISVQMKRAPYRSLGMNMSGLAVIGAAGDNIIYTYRDVNGDSVLEAQNAYTKENYTLVTSNSVQLLSGNGQIVLRIFENFKGSESNSPSIFELVGQNGSSKNNPSTFIDLATLKQVSINLSDYRKIILRTGFDNITGSYTEQDYSTYTPGKISNVIFRSKRRINGQLVKGRILF